MNGLHDLGGMDGFGPVEVEPDEPVFHAPWEGWVYALYVAGLGSGVFSIDAFRHAIERLAPEDYLAASYYERWLAGLEQLYYEHGVLDPAEVRALEAALEAGEAVPAERSDPDRFDALVEGVREAFDVERHAREPAFAPGDRVRVRERHPEGHTRCPRYARGAVGVVRRHRGTEVVPDARAHGDDAAEPVYGVRLDGGALWGEDAEPGTAVHLDLWERHLEPAPVEDRTGPDDHETPPP